MRKVLVTYASRGGSTVGVAEAIGRALAAQNLNVDVLPMADVHDLSPYQAVIAGSAVRQSRWLPEAMAFMETHQSALTGKPFAAFLVCLAMASDTARSRRTASSWLKPVRALVSPVSEGLFAGVLDLSKIRERRFRIVFRLAVMLGLFKEGDFRDWDAIRAWASTLPALLLAEAEQAAA